MSELALDVTVPSAIAVIVLAMGVATLISVEEYLSRSYSPDVEYVDGQLVEPNVGDPLHSLAQSNLIFALRTKYPKIKVLPELRSRISSTRYRLPDVCVTLSMPTAKVLLEPPFVAIEILSEDDRMTRVLERLQEFASIGTPNIWVIDPRLKEVFTYRDGVLAAVTGDAVATEDPRLELTRAEIFQE